jgi:hypothetical protein
VYPHALSTDLCDDLLNKIDELSLDQLAVLATQPDKLRRLFQLGATGNLYRRCVQEGLKLLALLGIHDVPVYKPTLIVAMAGAKQGIFHRDFKRYGLSITFSLHDKTMRWGDSGIVIKQPRRSGTVFDGGHCHASSAVPKSSRPQALLHLYGGLQITAKELLSTHQCLPQLAIESGSLPSLETYFIKHGGQIPMASGWRGSIIDEQAGTCDLRSPDGRRFGRLVSVLAEVGITALPAASTTRRESMRAGTRSGIGDKEQAPEGEEAGLSMPMAPAPLPDGSQVSLSQPSTQSSTGVISSAVLSRDEDAILADLHESIYESRSVADLDEGISRLVDGGFVDVMQPDVVVAPPVISDEEDATVALIIALQESMASENQTQLAVACAIGVSKSHLFRWMSCGLGYHSELEVNRQVSLHLGLAPAASIGTNKAPDSLGVWPDCLRASHTTGSHADHMQRTVLVNALQALMKYNGLREKIWQDQNVIEAIKLVAPVFQVYRRVNVATIGTALGFRLWYQGQAKDALNIAVTELNGGAAYRTVSTRCGILSGVLHEIGTSRRLSPQQVMSELIDEAKGTSSASTACPHDMDEELDHQEIAELVGGWT